MGHTSWTHSLRIFDLYKLNRKLKKGKNRMKWKTKKGKLPILKILGILPYLRCAEEVSGVHFPAFTACGPTTE